MKRAWKISGIIIVVVFVLIVSIVFIVPFLKPLEIKGIFVPYKYMVYGDHAEILLYQGEEEEVVIPERLLGHRVTVVGENSFDENQNLRSVSFPDCVEEIGNGAFWGCKSLEEVKLPSELKVIWPRAFTACKSLKCIEFPNQLEAIYNYAFKGCSLLAEAEIPETVRIIGDGAFYNCTNLREVSIPEGVQEIAGDAFEGTPWLEEQTEEFVTAGNNVLIRYNGDDTVVEISEGITYMGDFLFYSEYVDRDRIKITKVVFPKSVTVIGNFAFSYIENLEYIVLKNDKVILKPYAIMNCDNVTIVSAEGSTGQKYAEENNIPWMELEE